MAATRIAVRQDTPDVAPFQGAKQQQAMLQAKAMKDAGQGAAAAGAAPVAPNSPLDQVLTGPGGGLPGQVH